MSALDDLFKYINVAASNSYSDAVIIINNLTINVNDSGNSQANDYAPPPRQIADPPKQQHRWSGHSYPYDICECGVMTRDFASHIKQMAG